MIGTREDELTPEDLEAIKRREQEAAQKEHEASIKRQRARIRPMDRSNVVPKN